MLAFFAPVSSSKSSPYMSTSAARTNIIENAKPYTKTVTLASETNISLAESNATERICHIQRSNNDTATSFARKAQQFGPYSSSKTDMALSLDVKGNNHNGNINYKATASNGVTHEPSVFSVPKRSLFSSVLKRFSIQRSKTPESARRVETGAVTIDQKKHIFDEHSKPRRFRRWLTQRIRKRKSKDGTDVSEHSLASAEAVLEASGPTKQTPQLVGRSKSPTSVFARQSHVRVSLVGPDLPRPCSSMEELNDHYPVKASAPRCADIITSAGDLGEPLEVDHNASTGRTLGHIPPSTLATPLSTSSIGPSRECTLARNRSLRSTEERNRSHVHFSPLLINSPDVLHGNSFVSSKSEMQLTHPVATHKRSHVEDLRTSSPSYLRVAVAAFGYPTYAGDSSPFTRSIPAQRLRPMQLSLSSHQTNTVAFSSPDSPLHAAANLMSRSTAPSAHFKDPSLSAQPAHNSGATNFTFNLCHPSVPKDAVSNSTGQRARESSVPQHHKCSSVSPCPSPNVNVQPTPNGPTLRGPRVRSQTGTPDDHEHWQRSSLIMLAVTHASPRGRTSGVHESQQHSHIFDGIGDLSHFNDYSSPSDRSPTQMARSPLNGAAEVPGHDICAVDANSAPDHSSTDVDGYYFLRQVDRTELELSSLIKQAENYLNNEPMDEEASGLLRAAIGKGNLLINDKFVQFRGLCRQNLDSRTECHPANSTTVKLTTEVKDLDGFWAMVMLQVTDMFKMFDRIAKLRENGWKTEVGLPIDHVNGRSSNGMATKHRKAAPASVERSKANHSTGRRMAHERLETIKREMRAKKATMQGTESGDFVLFT